jgi:hypothetical protein
MRLLEPGTGNQINNRKKALLYIAENIIDTDSYDLKANTIITKNGDRYHVSAYAETVIAAIDCALRQLAT